MSGSFLPVLAANACALPELVTPDVNGYLFIPNDMIDSARCITLLLDNRARWASMGAASRAKAETHAHDNTIQHYLDWYQQVRPAMSMRYGDAHQKLG